MPDSSRQFPFFVSRAYGIVIGLGTGVFLFVFMSLFLPFGVSNYDPKHEYTLEFFLSMGGFMAGTTLVALLNELILKPVVIRKPGLKQILLWTIWLLLVLGLTNFLIYNLLGNWHDPSIGSALEFIRNCSMVFLFPITGTFFYFRFRDLKENYHQVLERSSTSQFSDEMLYFEGQGTSDRLSMRRSDFLYAKAQDNYIEFHYIQGEHLQKTLLRLSMTQLIEQSDPGLLLRCHRSYCVNLHQINSVRWGTKPEIRLHHMQTSIPISRSYRQPVQAALHQS